MSGIDKMRTFEMSVIDKTRMFEMYAADNMRKLAHQLFSFDTGILWH